MAYKRHIEGMFQSNRAVFDFTVTSAITLISHINLGCNPTAYLWGLTALLERCCAHTDAVRDVSGEL